MAKPVVQEPKSVSAEQVAVVAKKVVANIQVTPKVVATVSTSIFQDDTKVVFAGAPASIFSEATLAESLLDEAAAEFDEMNDDLQPLIDEDIESFIEEEIAPGATNPKRQRVAVEPVQPPKAVTAKPVALVVEKSTPTTLPEPASVVTLTHMRMRATGEPRPLAALFSRLSGGEVTPTGATEGKKSLLFERMKRT
jgi:hypothetical protein